jgi:Tfp pilus assembly protein PilV
MKNKNSGQTMVELIVGISIFVIVLLTTTVMVARSIQFTEVAIYRQKAVFLTKNGIEIARRERNLNDWDVFVGIGSTFPLTEIISYKNTDFTRVTVLNGVPGNDEADVNVTVTWDDIKGSHEVVQKTTLTNWENIGTTIDARFNF